MPFWKWALRAHRQLCKGSLGWSRGNFKKFCSSFWSLCSGVSNAASTSGDLCGSRAGFCESECVACGWSLRNVCQMNVLAAGQQMHIWCLRMIPCNLCLGGSSHEATNQTEPCKKCLLLLLTFPIQAWENYSPCSMGLPCFPTWQKSWAHYLPPTVWGGCGVDMRNPTKSSGIPGLKSTAHTKYQAPVKYVFSIRDRRSEGKLGTFCRQLKHAFYSRAERKAQLLKVTLGWQNVLKRNCQENPFAQPWPWDSAASRDYLNWASLEKAGILFHHWLLKPSHSTVLKAAEN